MSLKFADELLADVPEDVYLKVLRAFFGADLDSDHPSNELLESLLEAPRFFKHAVAVAFTAGRESAYDRDEWRVAYHAPIGWLRSSTRTRPEADEFLAYCAGKGVAGACLESRRSGATAWVRVPEAGDTDER